MTHALNNFILCVRLHRVFWNMSEFCSGWIWLKQFLWFLSLCDPFCFHFVPRYTNLSTASVSLSASLIIGRMNVFFANGHNFGFAGIFNSNVPLSSAGTSGTSCILTKHSALRRQPCILSLLYCLVYLLFINCVMFLYISWYNPLLCLIEWMIVWILSQSWTNRFLLLLNGCRLWLCSTDFESV